MKTIATITAALLITSGAAFAGHPHVGDAARNNPEGNQSSNASKGWDKLSTNASDGKAATAADKTD